MDVFACPVIIEICQQVIYCTVDGGHYSAHSTLNRIVELGKIASNTSVFRYFGVLAAEKLTNEADDYL